MGLTAAALLSVNNTSCESESVSPDKKDKDTFVPILKEFILKNYGNLPIEPGYIEQLFWMQVSGIKTSESNVRLEKLTADTLHIEVKRSLSRYYNLLLLQNGSRSAYQAFVASQESETQLQWETFQQRSHFLIAQGSAAFEALKFSCFTTISENAIKRAKALNCHFSLDSEKFLTDVMSQHPEIYPAYYELSTTARTLLPSLYLFHGRHLLYLEGGSHMIESVKSKLQSEEITVKDVTLCSLRWYINVCGFRGHENSKGSIYLTHLKDDAFWHAVVEPMNALANNPNFDVLAAILKYYRDVLGVDNDFLAREGAQMRYYSKDKGAELTRVFSKWSRAERQDCESISASLATVKATPTYRPAVRDNLLEITRDMGKTLRIFYFIEKAIWNSYPDAILSKQLDAATPVCYRELALAVNLRAIVDAYDKQMIPAAFSFDDKGNMKCIGFKPIYETDVVPQLSYRA